jgi:5'-3' exonuclease
MTLLLVDASNLLMRCAFGGDVPPEESTPTAIGMIDRAARELGATHLVCAFDYPDAPSWRKLEFPAYKAHRTRDTSLWLIHGAAACSSNGWCVEHAPGFEADDVIATIALRVADRAPVVVCSGDSDLLGLAAHRNITVARPLTGGEFQRFIASDVCEKYQIPAAHLLFDYKAMVGESGDNVPGVPGIGPKKAAALLHKLGSLEHIIHAGRGGYNKDSELVALHAPEAMRALRLVSLRPDAPVAPIQPSRCALRRRTAA